MKNIIVYGAGQFGSLISNIISYHSDLNIVVYGDDNNNKIGQFIDKILERKSAKIFLATDDPSYFTIFKNKSKKNRTINTQIRRRGRSTIDTE